MPLDHDEPDGPTIDLALIRRPAGDPATRIGSLFTNPGGPGGSGVEFVRTATAQFAPEVQARFDIVGVDPRGVGGSTPLRCFADTAEQSAFFSRLSPAPVTPEEEKTSEDASIELGQRCAEQDAEIARHLSTADVARDLHLLMQAVGDEALNFYGASYGTYLGATFANLFPDDVRTLVLDGVVEPVAYTGAEGDAGEPTFVRARSNHGASETLQEFLDLCAEVGETRCAFAAGGAPRTKFVELATAVRASPVPLPTATVPHGPTELDYGLFIRNVISGLYLDVGWPLLGEALEVLHREADPTALAELLTRLQGPATPGYDNILEVQRAIICADTANPDDPSAWPELAAAADDETPFVGGYWAYISQPCAGWPIETEDAYPGPFGATTAGAALVIGTRFDPATPYRNAEILADTLPGARLLTMEGVGHTAFGQGACVAEMSTYLVSGEVPAEGATCVPGRRPFDPLPEPAVGAGADPASGFAGSDR